MRRYISADYVVPVSSEPIKNGVVVLGARNEIIELLHEREVPAHISLEKYEGILVPGFINCHCHLELSHMKNNIPAKTGLIEFLKQVSRRPPAELGEIKKAIEEADEEMHQAGIVAVGDISNSDHTKEKN